MIPYQARLPASSGPGQVDCPSGVLSTRAGCVVGRGDLVPRKSGISNYTTNSIPFPDFGRDGGLRCDIDSISIGTVRRVGSSDDLLHLVLVVGLVRLVCLGGEMSRDAKLGSVNRRVCACALSAFWFAPDFHMWFRILVWLIGNM